MDYRITSFMEDLAMTSFFILATSFAITLSVIIPPGGALVLRAIMFGFNTFN